MPKRDPYHGDSRMNWNGPYKRPLGDPLEGQRRYYQQVSGTRSGGQFGPLAGVKFAVDLDQFPSNEDKIHITITVTKKGETSSFAAGKRRALVVLKQIEEALTQKKPDTTPPRRGHTQSMEDDARAFARVANQMSEEEFERLARLLERQPSYSRESLLITHARDIVERSTGTKSY